MSACARFQRIDVNACAIRRHSLRARWANELTAAAGLYPLSAPSIPRAGSMSEQDELLDRDYPIQEDMRFQEKLWKLERAGWVALSLIAVITLLGVFGAGPLSQTHAQSPGGDLDIRYQRFERNGAASQLQVKAKAGSDGQVWLAIDGALLERFTVESIHPQPLVAEAFGNGMRLQFQPDAQGWATAYLTLRPDGVGPAKSVARLNGQSVTLSQFIYP